MTKARSEMVAFVIRYRLAEASQNNKLEGVKTKALPAALARSLSLTVVTKLVSKG
jgi:hypothetical protein